MIYLYADPHIGHDRIRLLANRPFQSVKEMDNELVCRYNDIVKDNDEVYIVGDVSFRTSLNYTVKTLNLLKGRKRLVIGNHDEHYLEEERFRNCFVSIDTRVRISFNKHVYVIDHYPIHSWPGMFRGSRMLHGHSHNNVDNSRLMRMDIGVDNPVCNYAPISIQKVDEIMNEKWKIVKKLGIKE